MFCLFFRVMKETVFLASSPLHLFLETNLDKQDMNNLLKDCRHFGSMNVIDWADYLKKVNLANHSENAFSALINKIKRYTQFVLHLENSSQEASQKVSNTLRSNNIEVNWNADKSLEENICSEENDWILIEDNLFYSSLYTLENPYFDELYPQCTSGTTWSVDNHVDDSKSSDSGSSESDTPTSSGISSTSNPSSTNKKFCSETESETACASRINQDNTDQIEEGNLVCSRCSKMINVDKFPLQCDNCRSPFVYTSKQTSCIGKVLKIKLSSNSSFGHSPLFNKNQKQFEKSIQKLNEKAPIKTDDGENQNLI